MNEEIKRKSESEDDIKRKANPMMKLKEKTNPMLQNDMPQTQICKYAKSLSDHCRCKKAEKPMLCQTKPESSENKQEKKLKICYLKNT